MKKGMGKLKVPLAFQAEEAFKKAVAKVVAAHKRTGEPLVIWRDGKVVKVPPDQLEVREEQAKYTKEKKIKGIR